MTAARFIKITLPALLLALILPAAFAKQGVFPEGFLVKGGYGKLNEPNTPQPQGSKWSFEFTEEYSNEKHTVKPGMSFPLLESSSLQQLVRGRKKAKQGGEYRLWAMITKFEDNNFLYPVYFLPAGRVTGKPEPPEPAQAIEPNEPNEPNQPNEPNIAQKDEGKTEAPMNEPEDAVKVPDEILNRLKQRRTYTPEPVKDKPEPDDKEQKKQADKKPSKKSESDSRGQFEVLADKIGYISRNKNGRYIFKVEGFGRKLSRETYYLQPCEALEEALEEQKDTINKPRFTVAGITDTFEKKKYLLLHRAQFKYSYGNFGR